jgi:hypothetical protein
VRTGVCIDPPAIDDLYRVPIDIREGIVHLAEVPSPNGPAQESATADGRCFAVIGGGAD